MVSWLGSCQTTLAITVIIVVEAPGRQDTVAASGRGGRPV